MLPRFKIHHAYPNRRHFVAQVFEMGAYQTILYDFVANMLIISLICLRDIINLKQMLENARQLCSSYPFLVSIYTFSLMYIERCVKRHANM